MSEYLNRLFNFYRKNTNQGKRTDKISYTIEFSKTETICYRLFEVEIEYVMEWQQYQCNGFDSLGPVLQEMQQNNYLLAALPTVSRIIRISSYRHVFNYDMYYDIHDSIHNPSCPTTVPPRNINTLIPNTIRCLIMLGVPITRTHLAQGSHNAPSKQFSLTSKLMLKNNQAACIIFEKCYPMHAHPGLWLCWNVLCCAELRHTTESQGRVKVNVGQLGVRGWASRPAGCSFCVLLYTEANGTKRVVQLNLIAPSSSLCVHIYKMHLVGMVYRLAGSEFATRVHWSSCETIYLSGVS